ncbi:MAG: hypothetical protein ACE5JN_14750 [Candidatus Methylomirabilia bacterium]
MKLWLIALVLIIGLVLGVSGTRMVPHLSDLPRVLLGQGEIVEGTVVAKAREEDRILLTVATAQGSLVATFRERVVEIDLLIGEGDTLTLGVRRYEPFVEEPAIERVRKPGSPRSP